MSTKPIAPRLADNLRLLVTSQLQIQSARSVALDASALGVMAVDAGVATIIIATRGTSDHRILALTLLGLSLGMSVHTLRLPGTEDAGPSVADMREARETQNEHQLEEWVLEDLNQDIQSNEQALARKAPLFDLALRLLVLAILVKLVELVLE